MFDLRPNRLVHLTHWDDFEPGYPYELGTVRIGRNEAGAFDGIYVGSRPDAETTVSGMLLIALQMRLMCDSHLKNAAGLGAPGIDWLERPAPAPFATQLTTILTCISRRPLASRPGVGLLELTCETRRADGAVVLKWHNTQFARIRDQDAARPVGTASARRQTARTGEAATQARGRILGEHRFAREEIVAFARAFDPQTFHLDEAAAANSLFGALCASGWHTCAVAIRLLRDHLAREAAFEGFPRRAEAVPDFAGMRDVAWRKPVFVGDAITFALAPDASNAGSGEHGGAQTSPHVIVGTNQTGERVFLASILLAVA